MKTILFTVLIILRVGISYAQNHVLNHSFENKNNCPTLLAQVTGCCQSWYSYTKIGTPDYFDTCSYSSSGVDVPKNQFGFQQAIGGSYAGFFTYSGGITPEGAKEYLATVVTPLVQGKFYEVSISLNLANATSYGSDGIGVMLYQNYADTILSGLSVGRAPQIKYDRYGVIIDTTKWRRLKGYLLADSAYHHMVIGQFKDTPDIRAVKYAYGIWGGAYYYIDSVVVNEADNINIELSDSLLCVADTLLVGCFVNPVYFNSGNTFYVELSDANGSFSSPVIIGSKNATQSDSIKVTIPASLPNGSHYRMRLRASTPLTYSADNGFDIKIGISKPTITSFANNSIICKEDSLIITANSSTTNIEWFWWRPYTYPDITTTGRFSKEMSLADSGLYIIAASNNGCMSKPDTLNIQTANLTMPYLTLAITPNYNVPLGTQLTLYTTHSYTDLSPAYKWYKNGAKIIGAIDSFYKVILGKTFIAGDSFCVELFSSLQCPVPSSVKSCYSYTKYAGIGMNLDTEEAAAATIPNPVKDNAILTSISNIKRIEIYSMQGIKTDNFHSIYSNGKVHLNLSSLPAGNYYIVSFSDN